MIPVRDTESGSLSRTCEARDDLSRRHRKSEKPNLMVRYSLLLLPSLSGEALVAHAPSEEPAFVELATPRDSCYVQEPIHLTIRFGVEEEFLWTRAVQPFRQRLDLPVQVVAPWTDALPGAEALGSVESILGLAEPAGPTFVLNDGVRHARQRGDRVVDGRRFRVYEIEAMFLPTRAGELRVPAPALRLVHATRFEESLLDERRPLDQEELLVSGEPLAIRVHPLPEEGRPWAFTGAVGSFTARAEVDSREVHLGESLTLELEITGKGNLAWFETPDWRELGELRVLGVLSEVTPTARVFRFDLAPVSVAAREVPEIAFAYFDPSPPEGYRYAVTEPIEIFVEPPRTPGLEGRPPKEVLVEPPPAGEEVGDVRGQAGDGWAVPFFSVTALGALFLFVVYAMRRRTSTARRPAARVPAGRRDAGGGGSLRGEGGAGDGPEDPALDRRHLPR